jgi:hypothetical protein
MFLQWEVTLDIQLNKLMLIFQNISELKEKTGKSNIKEPVHSWVITFHGSTLPLLSSTISQFWLLEPHLLKLHSLGVFLKLWLLFSLLESEMMQKNQKRLPQIKFKIIKKELILVNL